MKAKTRRFYPSYVTQSEKTGQLAQIANVQYTPGNMKITFFGENHFMLPSDYTSNSLSFETKIASYFVVVSEIATRLRLGARVHGNTEVRNADHYAEVSERVIL